MANLKSQTSDMAGRPPKVVDSPGAGLLRVIAAMSGEFMCEVAAQPTSTVSLLKTMIYMATGIETFEQKLIFKATALGDDAAILGPGMFACGTPTLMLVRLDPKSAAEEHNRQLVLAAVKDGKKLKDLEYKYRGDREVVLAAVKLNPCEMQHAQTELIHNVEFMLAAIAVHPTARCYGAPELWLLRDFVYEAVQLDGLLLEYAPVFMDDLDVVLAAASNNGYALRHAGGQARSSKHIVLAAVEQAGCALCHAVDDLKCDREVVLAAVENDRMASVHVKGGLRSDPEVKRLVDQARQAAMLRMGCAVSVPQPPSEEFALVFGKEPAVQEVA